MRDVEFWFPIDGRPDGVIHARVSPEAISNTGFLFGPFPGGAQQKLLATAEQQYDPPSAYIFHTAFCCSTLLARALDVPDRTISLKEPNILMVLANQMRMSNLGSFEQTWKIAAPGLTAAGHGRERVVVKPTNAANRIAPFVMNSPTARAIVIHSDLDAFVLSIARKGEAGRQFVRRLYNIFSLDSEFAKGLPQREVFTLSDLQIAVLVWALQCEQLNQAITSNPSAYRMIHADEFLSNPLRTLRAASDHLALGLSEEDIVKKVESDVFRRHSKDAGEAYDAVLRQQERAEADQQFAESLAFVQEWGRNLPLPSTLTGASPLLT